MNEIESLERLLEHAKSNSPLCLLRDGECAHCESVKTILADGKAAIEDFKKMRDLVFRMARHIRNTDQMHPALWGVKGCSLLSELQKMHNREYNQIVIGGWPSEEENTEQ